MPVVCEFYGMTPSEFWRLTVPEFDALTTHMREVADARARAAGG